MTTRSCHVLVPCSQQNIMSHCHCSSAHLLDEPLLMHARTLSMPPYLMRSDCHNPCLLTLQSPWENLQTECFVQQLLCLFAGQTSDAQDAEDSAAAGEDGPAFVTTCCGCGCFRGPGQEPGSPNAHHPYPRTGNNPPACPAAQQG